MLCIYLSDVPENIKQTYVELARVMLKEQRDNADMTEYDFLLTNKPALVYGGEKAYYNLMKRCKEINGIKNVTVSTLWYGILLALNDERLLTFHKPHVLTGLEYDSMRSSNNNETFSDKSEVRNFDHNDNNAVLNYIKSHITKTYVSKHLNDVANDVEYTCYITMESTAESGGYKIREHELAPGIVCRPKYVMKKEVFEELEDEYKSCPICHTDLSDPSQNMYVFVPPEKELASRTVPPEQTKQTDVKDDYIVNEPALECGKHEIIAIPPDMVNSIDDETLLDIDILNFAANSYEFDMPTINDTLNSKRIAITNSADFKTMMSYRYPFIEKMSFNNLISFSERL